MYSSVFAVNPSDAVEICFGLCKGRNETAIRSDTFAVRLCGFLKGPILPMRIQGSKQVSPETVGEKENQMAIAKSIVEEVRPNATYVLDPGTAVKRIAELLGVPKQCRALTYTKIAKSHWMKKILENVEDWQNT